MSDEAKLDFTADDKVAKGTIDRLTKLMAGLEEQNRKLNEQAKKGAQDARKAVDEWAAGMKSLDDIGRRAMVHSDESWKRGLDTLKKQNEELHKGHSWLSKQGEELLKLGIGFISVEKGVEKVVEVYGEWRQHVKELGKEHEELAQRVVKTLHQAGLLKFGPEMEEFIASGAGGVATPEQTRQALAAVSNGAPNADVETQKQLTRETLKGVLLGNLDQRGTLIAKLHKIDPTKSAGDLADMASYAQAKAGNRAGELTDATFLRTVRALKAGGQSTDEAFATGLTALQDEQQLRKFTKLGELLDESNKFAPSGHPHRLTPEEQLKKKFGQLNSAERYQALLAGGKMAQAMSPDMAFNLKMMPEEQRQQLLAELNQAQRDNYDEQSIKSIGEFGFGKKAIVAQESEKAKAAQAEALGGTRSVLTNLQTQRLANTRHLGQFAGHYLETAGEELFYNTTANFTGREDYVRRAVQRGQALGDITSDQADKMIAALDRNTEEMKRNTRVAAQAQPNVNGHNESHGASGGW